MRIPINSPLQRYLNFILKTLIPHYASCIGCIPDRLDSVFFQTSIEQ